MEFGSRFIDRFNDAFGLPPEVMLNLPLIMMVGGKSLILENHQGILEYSRVRIRIRLLHGELVLQGHNLVIQSISNDEIQIKGEIVSLDLVTGGETK